MAVKKTILVSGDRNWGSRGQEDWDKIRAMLLEEKPYKVIEGEAKGADTMTRWVCDQMGIYVDAMPAEWDKYGKRAGPIRNQYMLKRLLWYRDDHEHEIKVIAFHSDLENSKGTAHMVDIARKAGVEVQVIL